MPTEVLRRDLIDTRAAVLDGAGVRESALLGAFPPSVYRHGQYAKEGDAAAERTQRLVRQDLTAAQRSRLWVRSNFAIFCGLSLVLGCVPLLLVLLIELWQLLSDGARAVGRALAQLCTWRLAPESSHHYVEGVDFFHKPLTPEEYITLRLETQLRFYQSRLPGYSRGHQLSHVFLLLLSVCGAVLSQLQLPMWIAVVTAVASCVTSWIEFSGKSKKLARYNGCITALRNVRLWWDSLQPSGRQASNNIERLVSLTEDICGTESKARCLPPPQSPARPLAPLLRPLQ